MESKERKEKLHEAPDTGVYEAPTVSPISGDYQAGIASAVARAARTSSVRNIVTNVAVSVAVSVVMSHLEM